MIMLYLKLEHYHYSVQIKLYQCHEHEVKVLLQIVQDYPNETVKMN